VTLKPNPSQPADRKIKVWNVPQPGWRDWGKQGLRRVKAKPGTGNRSVFSRISKSLFSKAPFSKSRFKWYHAAIACLLGGLTAIVQSMVLHLAHPALSQEFNQTIAQTVSQTVRQTAEALEIIQPVEVPNAVSGLSQPRLWFQAAKLTAYLGHLPYGKPDAAKLTLFPSTPPYMTRADEYLHQDAVAALKRMMEAAQLDGVSLFLVSGFRDLSTQATLFQNRATEHGSAELAAKSVAPPGYSEHHTGYAVDLADGLGDFLDFEKTLAFRWMMAHAQEYGFELSFPANNDQGVDYEPWHWRFVRSPEASEVFAAARSKTELDRAQT